MQRAVDYLLQHSLQRDMRDIHCTEISRPAACAWRRAHHTGRDDQDRQVGPISRPASSAHSRIWPPHNLQGQAYSGETRLRPPSPPFEQNRSPAHRGACPRHVSDTGRLNPARRLGNMLVVGLVSRNQCSRAFVSTCLFRATSGMGNALVYSSAAHDCPLRSNRWLIQGDICTSPNSPDCRGYQELDPSSGSVRRAALSGAAIATRCPTVNRHVTRLP